MQVKHVLEACLYVDDLEAAEAFYKRVLGIEPFTRIEGRHAFYRLGSTVMLLFNPEATSNDDDGPIPPHGARGAGHIAWVMMPEELDDWREHLRANDVEIESEFEWPKGKGTSLYFRDPSGNSIELATPGIWGLEARYREGKV